MNWQKLYAQTSGLVASFCRFARCPLLSVGLLIRVRFTNAIPTKYSHENSKQDRGGMEITKALAALQPLYGKGNIEIVTNNGHRVRGIVRSMKTTQALSTPTLKVERADGAVVKIPFTAIVEIINH